MNRTELSKSKKFYTYGHYLDGHLIYLGEGKGQRAWEMNKRPYKDRRDEVVVRIFGMFDNKQIAVFNESLLIYQERMDGNTHLLNQAEYGRGRRGCKLSEEHKQKIKDNRPDTSGENSPHFGKFGSEGANFKGLAVGTHKTTGKTIVFNGKKCMTTRKFVDQKVYECINGRKDCYLGFTFIRTTDEEFLTQLLEQDHFHDEQSKQILQNYLQR